MNVFVLDKNPILAAKYHNDKHCVKMIVESTQLLCNAHHTHSENKTELYRQTHKNHPANKWVTKSDSNYRWLWSLAINLCCEYTKRYKRTHKCTSMILHRLIILPENIGKGHLTPFWSPTGYEYGCCKKYDTAVQAYRAYYKNEKSHLASWRKGTWEPYWWRSQ